jgi:phage shock protein A
MSKRGIIGRVAQLSHANVNAVIDAAENPRQTVDRLARDYATTIAEAEYAIADLEGNRRVTADDQREDAEAAELWAAAAATASQTADELRAGGDGADADRFDDLARIALARELAAENDVDVSQHTITAQTESVETLTRGLGQMHAKLSELTRRRNSLGVLSRGTRGQRPGSSHEITNVDVMDPAIDVALFQDVVRREESSLRGGEAPTGPPAAEADEFGDPGGGGGVRASEIEERLQSLKMARAMASALARSQDQPFR